MVQHEYCEINAETKAKNEFTFYSLYMHLLPWDQYQSTERLVLKKGWNARNSVPHANPDAEQQRDDEGAQGDPGEDEDPALVLGQVTQETLLDPWVFKFWEWVLVLGLGVAGSQDL